MTKRTLYPAESVIQEWDDLAAIIGWAKAKPEDLANLAKAMGEDEVAIEPLATLPGGDTIPKAVSDWVNSEKNRGALHKSRWGWSSTEPDSSSAPS